MISFDHTSTFVLDIRDYNIDVNHKQSDMRLPFAYLKRFIKEIPKDKVHVIAGDRVELNLGLRYLMGKGYRVVSYQIINYPCKEKM